jgi:hypothetical protein
MYDDQSAPPNAATGAWIYGSFVPGGESWTVDGPWTLRILDDAGANESVLHEYHLTPHFAGGPDAIARTGIWTSVIHSFGEPVTIENVNWSAHVPGAAVGVDVEIRTCIAPCVDEPWVAVTAPGAKPAAPPGTHAQVRARFRSDGIDATWLDWVDVLAVPQ